MGLLKKWFSTGHVYAGPEQMGVSESVRDESEKGKKDMDETGKKRKKILKRVSIKRRKNDDTMLEAVYAAPDVLSQLANQNTKSDVSDNRAPYPMNNADLFATMKAVYAAPDILERVVQVNSENNAGIVPKGMSAPVTAGNGSVHESDSSAADLVDCPVCGNKSRRGKFCECCGSVLK